MFDQISLLQSLDPALFLLFVRPVLPKRSPNGQGRQDLEVDLAYAENTLEVRSPLVQNGRDDHQPDRPESWGTLHTHRGTPFY